jgi:glutamate carboxypeptidase
MPTDPTSVVADRDLFALRARLTAAEPELLADLERLVNVDCGSYTREGVNEVAAWTADFLARLGGEVTRHADPAAALGDTVEAVFRGAAGGPRALLIGHTDTVFPVGTVAERPFRVADGIATGPGVTDMKAGLLTLLYGLEAVLATGQLPFERLTVIANPDEEIGSPVSTPHVRRVAAESDVAFVLECARANGDIVSARKGTVDYVVTITGRAAHAGVEPEKGRSAILEAAHQVVGLHALAGQWPGVTCNVGVIEGGTRPNVVAERVVLEVDLRAVDRAAMKAATAAVQALAAAPTVPDVVVAAAEIHRHGPMEKLPRTKRLVEHAQALAARLGFSVRDATTGGASDANTTAGMGVPTLDGLGPIGGLDHSPDEWLDARSIVPRTTLFAALLLATGRDPEVGAWRAGALR